ncbi:MAG: hypothetical protein QOE60_54 [Thermoleophilaceae bacterium]|nr:hypothetical protein [Thermoleophilaceae bacterium]
MRSTDPDKRSCPARLRARCAAACAAGRSRLRSEAGSALIEVMVGAVVLSIATVGLLNGLDGAQGTATKNRARSVASALAEQDQERLRSMDVKTLVQTLVNTSSTRTVVVRGVGYTVTSSASWATDQGGVVSCSNNSKTAANIRIVSDVSSPASKGNVDLASLVTPPAGTFGPNEGRAIVKVAKRDGNPISGASVNLTGTASASAVTNSLGCAVFGFMPQGGYTASVSGLGLVDWQGNSPITKGTSVTAGASTTASVEADTAAEIRANFDTVVNGNTITTTPAAAAPKSQFLTVLNSKLTVGFETFEASPPGAPNSLVTAAPLFPFLDGYGVYAGKCVANNPANPPTSNPGALQIFSPTAGQIMTTPRVRLPSVNVRVVIANTTTTGGAAGQNGLQVKIYPQDAGCDAIDPQTSAAATYGSTSLAGSLPNPGLPYGRYKLCAQRTTGSPAVTTHGNADVFPYDNSNSANTDEIVSNTNPAGNGVAWNASGGIIRVWIKPALTGGCP